ncbi:MAG: hypothetical protein DRR16_11490 [Candidatus Parabeggiatoa sp. nov. 3]|jgi:chemotaxis signal transduction protein|nr:MAG: hypothetical protein DRR00_09615 [Gammaproteobacteria bacterium]RKZ67312.1 MAG: hypothetical protein DRQ99_07080 [Gammaproteobacteria bacterium]RKZ85693.1 MAG: hypothetical protein DRR16_11490 [Gammaproteobacteria bacterium]
MTEEKVVITSRAWLLDFGRDLKAAVGHHEMWQVLISPKLFDVPCTSPYCCEVLIFQDRILPVLDIQYLLDGDKMILTKDNVVGIAVYQDDPTHPIHYAGLHLASTPQNIYVSDDTACDLPEHQQYWEPLALSCFSYKDQAIPIIELAYLFSSVFNTLQQSND